MSSIGIRNYLLDDDDNIYRLSIAKLDRLISGLTGNEIARFSGKKIRKVEIVVKLVDRRPVEVIRVAYHYLHFKDDGSLDLIKYDNDARDCVEAAMPDLFSKVPLLPGESSKNVLFSTQKFAKRKYVSSVSWKPNSKLECKVFDIAIEIIKCKSI